jgi:hypothetical protein
MRKLLTAWMAFGIKMARTFCRLLCRTQEAGTCRKGKNSSGRSTRMKVLMQGTVAECSVVVKKCL